MVAKFIWQPGQIYSAIFTSEIKLYHFLACFSVLKGPSVSSWPWKEMTGSLRLILSLYCRPLFTRGAEAFLMELFPQQKYPLSLNKQPMVSSNSKLNYKTFVFYFLIHQIWIFLPFFLMQSHQSSTRNYLTSKQDKL